MRVFSAKSGPRFDDGNQVMSSEIRDQITGESTDIAILEVANPLRRSVLLFRLATYSCAKRYEGMHQAQVVAAAAVACFVHVCASFLHNVSTNVLVTRAVLLWYRMTLVENARRLQHDQPSGRPFTDPIWGKGRIVMGFFGVSKWSNGQQPRSSGSLFQTIYLPSSTYTHLEIRVHVFLQNTPE